MTLKRIDIEECHKLLLQIATVFDQICHKYDIPYYMLGGTMLGAIRHKGFIPWDDDMDFGIPRPYFTRFQKIVQAELPDNYVLHFPQQRGYIKIKLKGSLLVEKIFDQDDELSNSGIAIDIFPLDGADNSTLKGFLHTKCIFCLLRIQEGRFCSLSIRSGLKKVVAYVIKRLPIDDMKLARYIDLLMQKKTYEGSQMVANFYGHWRDREIFDKKIFLQTSHYCFEGLQLSGVSRYDVYLTSLYGDYMQLPPKSAQLVHADEMYVPIDKE